MQKPMISVAGIRGKLGESLAPEEFRRFAAAYASTLEGKTVVVGRDTRPSGPMLRDLALEACLDAGCDVLDLGVVPTPTVGLMVAHLGAGGGIAVTASHNPIEWNALKFFSSRGILLTQEEMDTVLERYQAGASGQQGPRDRGDARQAPDAIRLHLEKVLAAVNAERIRQARLSVAVDLCNGAAAALLPQLLDRLGCRTVTLFEDPSRAFERPPEPLPENLELLCETVRAHGAQVGFAADPDADRLALVDETGRAIGEERTLTLVSRFVLQNLATGATAGPPPPLVANLSTTRALDDVAAEFGTHVERTRIGEVHVVERMLATGAVIGGEGNGGVIYPTVHPGRDAATAVALLLDAMATAGKPLSQINSQVPDYAMVKAKTQIEGKETKIVRILERLRQVFLDAREFDDQDGLKIVWPDSWLHVRPSGTEPILRVFAEAPTEQSARSLADRALACVADGR